MSESENKELWNNAYTLTLDPKWIQGYMWIKKGFESIEGDLTEVSLYWNLNLHHKQIEFSFLKLLK